MRVLIVSNTYPPADISGVGALVYETACQLGAGAHHVRVLTRRPPASDPYAVATGGPKLLFPLFAAVKFLRLAAAAPYDLVHGHEADCAFVAFVLRLARLFGRRAGKARMLVTLHVSYLQEFRTVRAISDGSRVVSRPTAGELRFKWLRAPLHWLLGRATARLADGVVTISRATAGELERDYGTGALAVIPNGVTEVAVAIEEKPAALAGAEDADSRDPVVLYAGALRTRKAVAVLLEAFARVVGAVPGATLALAGDGEQRPALEAQAERLGLGGAVRFLGAVPRDEMATWFAAADVFCLPSIDAGFPVSTLQAMAAGLPIVASRVSGIPEAVDDGVTGLLVAPEEAGALADALERLTADAELRRRMGESARQVFRERFTIATVAGLYIDLWQEMIEGSQ